jgi:ribonuclease R
LIKKNIKSFFVKNSGIGIKSKMLAKKLRIEKLDDYIAMKEVLHSLVDEGFLVRKGKRYHFNLAGDGKISGKVHIVDDGNYGFVIPQDSNLKDIFISDRNLGTAFHDDVVEVILLAKKKGKNIEGQITKIISRGREEIIGTLKKTKSFYFVEPDDIKIHRDIYVSKVNLGEAKNGDKVVVNEIEWSSNNLNPEGKIKEILGKTGSYDTEITALARELNLSYKFPEKVIEEAEKISEKISQSEIHKRLDLRDSVVFTVDPDDAKDFDDAVSVEKLDNGNYKLGIHIADVSHFVTQNKYIFEEAYNRCTSIYFVGKVIPMLPERLSNTICSLVPLQDRLTYSVTVEITKRGKVVSYSIDKSIIKSKRRFTYKEVQKILDDGTGDYFEELYLLNRIAKTLKQNRSKKGSINFITPEVEFDLDDKGIPINITVKQISESNNLIEELMLLANQITAKHIISQQDKRKHVPFIYRIHDSPDPEKLQTFAAFVKSLGYSFDANTGNQSKQLQHLLDHVKGTNEEAIINEIAIRSMAKAVYSPFNIGHYGLGFEYYTHFTSPIRRFPDLIVHDILFKFQSGKTTAEYPEAELNDICERSSDQERKAVTAERISVKLKQMEYLRNHIGEEFEGIISGITNFGMFVELSNILAEGLVKLRDMDDDFYFYDEKNYALIGKRTGKKYRLGDKVSVRVIRIVEEKRGIDFLLLNNE